MKKQFSVISDFKPAGDQIEAIQSLVEGLKKNNRHQTLIGVTGSGKTFTMAHVIALNKKPTLVLAPNKTLAAQLYGEMKEFFPNNAVEYFVSYYDYYQPEAYVPSSDTFIEKDASINEHIERMRLSATKSLLERKDCIIVATVSAIYGLGDPKSYLSMVLHLDRGDIIDQRKILRRLTELQYERNEIDFRRATYRVRGDVIDVYPAETEEYAIRIELFGDEIDNLSLFDPLTGKVLNTIPRITIYPKTHYVTERQIILDTIEKVKVELKGRVKEFEKQNKLLEAQRIEQRTKFDIEMMLELGYCSGIENYSRYLSGRNEGEPPPTLVDYLPKDSLVIIDESHVTIPQLGGMYKGDRARKENLVNYGFRLPSALDNRPLKFEEFKKLHNQTICVSATPGNYEVEISDNVVEQVVRPTGLVDPEVIVRPVATQVDDVLSEIRKRVNLNERVLITTLTKRMAEDLTSYLEEHDVRVRYLHSDIDTVERMEIIRDLRLGAFDVLVGINLLREGLDMPEVSLVAIFDADKEGFLRSDRSLIQTIGRAARNINGMAILYADKITKSINKAINETNRRRNKQIDYNKKHDITPLTIKKAIKDIMEASFDKSYKKSSRFGKSGKTGKSKKTSLSRSLDKSGKQPQTFDTIDSLKEKTGITDKTQILDIIHEATCDVIPDIHDVTPKKLLSIIKSKEEEMYKQAKNLEFEKAAHLRDEIIELRKLLINI